MPTLARSLIVRLRRSATSWLCVARARRATTATTADKTTTVAAGTSQRRRRITRLCRVARTNSADIAGTSSPRSDVFIPPCSPYSAFDDRCRPQLGGRRLRRRLVVVRDVAELAPDSGHED